MPRRWWQLVVAGLMLRAGGEAEGEEVVADSLSVVFAGCATEDLKVANAIQQKLEYDAEVEVWTEGMFVPSDSALTSLLEKCLTVDFAVLIATGTDTLTRKVEYTPGIDLEPVYIDVIQPMPRDNVLLELGLFMGAIGKERTFLVIDRSCSDLKMPTDLSGVNRLDYDGTKANMQSAVGSACTSIRERIQDLGRRKRE